MQGLYIASTRPLAGKTLLACSLGVLLQKHGYKVGFMKPLGSRLKRVEAGNGDADALIVQEVLGQEVKPEALTPVMIPSWSSLLPALPGQTTGLYAVKKSYAAISRGKDVTLVCGIHAAPFAGSFAGLDTVTLARELNLNVILVERYTGGVNYDSLLFMRKILEGKLAGVVINDVPENDLPAVRAVLLPFLRENGVRVLGVIPHENRLGSTRVSDLAYDLNGRIVAGNKKSSNLVEGFIIGTMQVENFMSHLRLNPQRAVIAGGDRADLQLAALHGNAPCVILTGNMGPHEFVRAKAEEAAVPLITVKEDSYQVARHMSSLLNSQKFHELAQIKAGVALVEASIDIRDFICAHA